MNHYVSFVGADDLAALHLSITESRGRMWPQRQVCLGARNSDGVAYVTADEARDVAAAWSALADEIDANPIPEDSTP